MPKRYEVILNDILTKITNGTYKNGDMLPTENSMLSYYNVSRITIQKAMNILVSRNILERTPGRGTFVKDSSKVYSTTNTSNNLYAIITPFQEPETMNIIKGVQEVMSEKNLYLTIQFTDYSHNTEVNIINKLIHDGVNGIIIYALCSELDREFYSRLICSSIPVVFIDKSINGTVSNLVISDNLKGSYQATEHLIKCGHKRIAYASYSLNSNSLVERVKGFVQCMSDHDLKIEQGDIKTNILSEVDAASKFNEIFTKKPDISAIFCSSDNLARAFYMWASTQGIRIPEDVSVCGFDNNSFCENLVPSLTTVEQKFNNIGKEAAKMILNINNLDPSLKHVIYIPTKLIKRSSVKQIN